MIDPISEWLDDKEAGKYACLENRKKNHTNESMRMLLKDKPTYSCKVSKYLCVLCGDVIVKGDRFRRSGNFNRAHESCIERGCC